MKVTKEPFGGFICLKNCTKEQYEKAKKSGAIIFANVIDSSKNKQN